MHIELVTTTNIEKSCRPLLLTCVCMLFNLYLQAGVGGGPFVVGLVLGGSKQEHITGSALLSNGNIVVCGWTESSDIPTRVPGFKNIPSGSAEAFVAVLDQRNLSVKSFTYYGGEQNDKATGVAVDSSGRIIIVGETQSPRLAMSAGAFSQLYSADTDGFVAVFNSTLTTLERATYINGSGDDMPTAVTVDRDGGIFLCGTTTSRTSFPTTNGYDRTYNGGTDGFVMKFAPALSNIEFSSYFGSGGEDRFAGLFLTNDGALAVTGSTSSANYETFPLVNPMWWLQPDRPYDWTYNGGTSDAVLTIFSRDGAHVLVSTFYGGSGADIGTSVFGDSRGRIVIVGETSSSDLPIVGGLQTAMRGQTDVMAAMFAGNGRTLAGSTFFGGTGSENVSRVIPVTDDIWLVAGTTTSSDLPSFGAATTAERRGGTDGYVAKIGINIVAFCTTIGWDGDDVLTSCLLDRNGDLVLSGSTTSKRIVLSNEELSAYSETDALVVKWAFGTLDLGTPRGGERMCAGQLISFSWSTVDMPPSEQFTLEYSHDQIVWSKIAAGLTGGSYQWQADLESVDTNGVFVRVRTQRGHVSSSIEKMRIDPRVQLGVLSASAFACLNQRYIMLAEAEGLGLRYSWRRNGQTLPGNGRTYVVESVTLGTAGRYECIVTGGCGQSVSSPIFKVAVPLVPIITQQPQNVAVLESAPAELVIDGLEGSKFTWYKLGYLQEMGSGRTLRFAKTTPFDAGLYWCALTTECHTVVSDTVELHLQPVSVYGDGASLSPLVLKSEANSIYVFDFTGRLVWLGHPGDRNLSFDELFLSGLTSGVYLVVTISAYGELKTEIRIRTK